MAVSGVAFGFCIFAGAYLTADCLSEEKRDGTLGLLFLTDLKGYDVVLGKLFAMTLNTFYAVFSIVPILAIGLLWGGIMLEEFWRMALLLPSTLFFSVALGMFVSAISTRGRRAWVGTIGLIILFTGVPWALAYSTFQMHGLLILSPVQTFLHVFDPFFIANPDTFWSALSTQHLLSWFLLVGASIILPHTWKESPPNAFRTKLRLILNRATLGSSEQRRLDRTQWLLPNPIVWLSRRERHRQAAFWGFLGLFFCLWMIGTALDVDFWTQPDVIFATAFLLHLIIKLWLTLETSRRLADDKRSGALELLLVTPLTVAQLLNGMLAGVKRQFLFPIAAVLGLDLFLLAGALLSPQSQWQMPLVMTFLAFIGVFITDCYTLVWVGFWEGLQARNSTQAFLRSVMRVLVVPWGIFAVLSSLVSVAFFNGIPGFGAWIIVTWFATTYFNDAFVCGRTIHKITDNFRLATMQISLGEPKTFWPAFVLRCIPTSLR